MAGEKVSMEGSQRPAHIETDRLADTSYLLADLPGPKWTMLLVLPLALLIGFFYSPWEMDQWYLEWPIYSILLYAMPAWLGAIISLGWLRLMGGSVYLYRTAMLALAMLLILGLVLVLGSALSALGVVTFPEWYIFAYASLAMILHLTHLMTATSRWLLALPATLAQPLLGLLPVLAWYYADYDWAASSYAPIVLTVVFIATFIGVAQLAMWIGTRPLRENYGVSGVDVFRGFLEHWVEGGDAGRNAVEGFFRTFSEPVFAKAEVIAFRERGGDSPIATVVVPSLHPGPWGELGGSDMPRKFERSLGNDHGHVLTFHGASDHDLNPVDLAEVQKLSDHMKDALDNLQGWTDRASPSVRVGDGTTAMAQAFGDAVMAAQTSAPKPTDDVDGPAGHVIDLEMEAAGADPGVFIDCHNCLLPGAGHVHFGTPKARRMRDRVGEATRKALAARHHGLRVGAGHVPNAGEFRSMGPTGVQALVIEVKGQRTAWVLADGNNMEQHLREKVRDSVLDKVDEAEVLTTDNHIVNVSVGGFNPVGLKDDHQRFVAVCNEAVDMAIADLRDAECTATREEVGDVLVWGKGNTIRLSASINAAVAASKAALVAAMLVAVVIGVGAMWYL